MSTLPLPIADDAVRSFAEPWQAEAFALIVALHQAKVFEWSSWVDTFSSQPGDTVETAGNAVEAAYYERWLKALEAIAVDRGLMTGPEVDRRVDEWRRAYLRTPHGKPIELACGLPVDTADEVGDHRYHHGHDHHDHDHDQDHGHAIQAVPIYVSPAMMKPV